MKRLQLKASLHNNETEKNEALPTTTSIEATPTSIEEDDPDPLHRPTKESDPRADSKLSTPVEAYLILKIGDSVMGRVPLVKDCEVH